jgi:two-component system, LuxR family, response regulator FixJ
VPTLIAVIDDDESIRDSLKTLLRSAGYQVTVFESAEVFLESGLARGTACLILDVRMPGMDGPELQVRLRNDHSGIPIIFITGHDDGPVRERVLKAGAVNVLNKPFRPAALLSTLQVALEGSRYNAEGCSPGG